MAPFSLVPTPILELMLQDAPEEAIEEFNRLRDIHCHLLTHLRATKQQTDSTVDELQSILNQAKPLPGKGDD